MKIVINYYKSLNLTQTQELRKLLEIARRKDLCPMLIVILIINPLLFDKNRIFPFPLFIFIGGTLYLIFLTLNIPYLSGKYFRFCFFFNFGCITLNLKCNNIFLFARQFQTYVIFPISKNSKHSKHFL